VKIIWSVGSKVTPDDPDTQGKPVSPGDSDSQRKLVYLNIIDNEP